MRFRIAYWNTYGGTSSTSRPTPEFPKGYVKGGRMAAQVARVKKAGVSIFAAMELKESKGYARKFATDMGPQFRTFIGKDGNHCIADINKWTVELVENFRLNTEDEAPMERWCSVFRLDRLGTEADSFLLMIAHVIMGDRDSLKKRAARDVAARAKQLREATGLPVVICIDRNSGRKSKGYPTDILNRAGFKGLREKSQTPVRGADLNSWVEFVDKDPRDGFWIEDVHTSPDVTVLSAQQQEVGGESDHNLFVALLEVADPIP